VSRSCEGAVVPVMDRCVSKMAIHNGDRGIGDEDSLTVKINTKSKAETISPTCMLEWKSTLQNCKANWPRPMKVFAAAS
jgi:hypothetical protein